MEVGHGHDTWPTHASGRVKIGVSLLKYCAVQVKACQKQGWCTSMTIR